MVFPYLAALFSQNPKKKEPSPLFKKFPELNQGQQYLQRRNMVQHAMKGHLKTIEGFQCQGQNSMSWCDNSSPCPSYGYCPPTPVNIKPVQDDYPANPNPNPKLQLFASKHANFMTDISGYVANPPTGLQGRNIVLPQLTGAAFPWPPAGLLPQGHCNYLNVCAPRSYNLTEQEIVHGEKGPTTIEEAANAAAAKYGFTCKSYDSTTYGPNVKFKVGGQPVEVQQDFCALEGGNINVTPLSSLTSLTGASYGAGHGGLVLLHP